MYFSQLKVGYFLKRPHNYISLDMTSHTIKITQNTLSFRKILIYSGLNAQQKSQHYSMVIILQQNNNCLNVTATKRGNKKTNIFLYPQAAVHCWLGHGSVGSWAKLLVIKNYTHHAYNSLLNEPAWLLQEYFIVQQYYNFTFINFIMWMILFSLSFHLINYEFDLLHHLSIYQNYHFDSSVSTH